MNNLEVHVGVISFYNGKELALKRSESKRLYPGLWEYGGMDGTRMEKEFYQAGKGFVESKVRTPFTKRKESLSKLIFLYKN